LLMVYDCDADDADHHHHHHHHHQQHISLSCIIYQLTQLLRKESSLLQTL
jgi:hypothetical protein